MTKLRTLLVINATAYSIAFLHGFLGIDMNGLIAALTGIAMLVSLVWMLVIVLKNDEITS